MCTMANDMSNSKVVSSYNAKWNYENVNWRKWWYTISRGVSLAIQQLKQWMQDIVNVPLIIVVAIVDQVTEQVQYLSQHLIVSYVLLITDKNLIQQETVFYFAYCVLVQRPLHTLFALITSKIHVCKVGKYSLTSPVSAVTLSAPVSS